MKKVKVSLSGLSDMLAFKNLAKEREKLITKSSAKKIANPYKSNTNKLADYLHPKFQMVCVKEIINDTPSSKTFVLEGLNNDLAYFKAGMSITLIVNINGKIYKRPYTLISSPKEALNNIYKITIKKVPNGKVSSYMIDKAKVGDEFVISAPFGNFVYSNIRDCSNVIALCGGSGITPFVSMAESILDGSEDFNLTIIYGSKSKEDIMLFEELDNIVAKTNKIKVIYVLEEKQLEDDFEHGLINKKLIDKYKTDNASFFVCGSVPFYAHINEILKMYKLAKKYVRVEDFKAPINVERVKYKLTIKINDELATIPCYSDLTILEALEKSGVNAKSKCRVGTCGFCRAKLISGAVNMSNDKRRKSDKEFNYIHPCVAYPLTDIVIEL